MAIKDWVIEIDRQTAPVSQAGFGKPLILSTEKEFKYKTFEDVKDITDYFKEDTETYKVASRIMGQSPRPAEFAIMGVNFEGDIDDPSILIEALNESGGDYFFLVSPNQEKEVIEALVEWAESQQKMYGFSTDDLELVEDLSLKEYDNSFCIVHEDPKSYPAEGWIGACASYEPGEITWNYQQVSGVAPSGVNTNDVDDANGNVIIRQHGNNHTHSGVVLSGEFIDIIHSEHYLYSRIDESVFGALLRNKKIPYENAGISLIETAVETPIKVAANNGMVAEEDGEFLYEVSTPKRSETTANDRAKRFLPNVKAEIAMAGAIHSGKISITIKV